MAKVTEGSLVGPTRKTYFTIWSGKDGTEVWQKTLAMTVGGSALGVISGAIDGRFITRLVIKQYDQYAKIMSRYTLTYGAAGLLYGQVTNRFAQLRGRDDEMNHLYGGFVAGAPFAFRHGRIFMGICMGVFLGATFCGMKLLYLHCPNSEDRAAFLLKNFNTPKWGSFGRQTRPPKFKDEDY